MDSTVIRKSQSWLSSPTHRRKNASSLACPFSLSALTFKLHPLVMLNISDQLNPSAASCATGNGSSNADAMLLQNPRVYGCVIGLQIGRMVEIFNIFELLFDPTTDTLNRPFLEKKQELYKKVFPKFYILGRYSTGSDATESDMLIHRALMDINESSVYVLLNPAINHSQKDLPVTIYESEFHVIDGIPQSIFLHTSYTIDTVEAEGYRLIMLLILSHLMAAQQQLNVDSSMYCNGCSSYWNP